MAYTTEKQGYIGAGHHDDCTYLLLVSSALWLPDAGPGYDDGEQQRFHCLRPCTNVLASPLTSLERVSSLSKAPEHNSEGIAGCCSLALGPCAVPRIHRER